MEDNRYKRGKIYKIVCNTTGLQYIGSTCEPTLARRLVMHRASYNNYLKGKGTNTTSFEILKNNNYSIILVEDCPCERKEQLLQRERYLIENTECVNKYRPITSAEEKKKHHIEYCKEYYQENREQLVEQMKEYHQKNRERILEKDKEYYQENRERIIEQHKEYYQANKDKILERKKEKYNCECGGKYSRGDKPKHLRTQMHISYCEQIQQSQSL